MSIESGGEGAIRRKCKILSLSSSFTLHSYNNKRVYFESFSESPLQIAKMTGMSSCFYNLSLYDLLEESLPPFRETSLTSRSKKEMRFPLCRLSGREFLLAGMEEGLYFQIAGFVDPDHPSIVGLVPVSEPSSHGLSSFRHGCLTLHISLQSLKLEGSEEGI